MVWRQGGSQSSCSKEDDSFCVLKRVKRHGDVEKNEKQTNEKKEDILYLYENLIASKND